MKATPPTVSGPVTVYNRALFLRECLESILESTWVDFEIVLVDDCSTDGSDEIALEFAEKDDRIRFFRNLKNLGDYPNRNCAASHARGEFLKYLDADDTIYPHSLEIMVSALQKNPSASLALSHNMIDCEMPFPILFHQADTFRSFLIGRNVLGVGPSAAIIRRDAFESAGGFSGTRHIGDTELWLKLAAKGSIVALQPSLIWWRRHGDQESIRGRKNLTVTNQRFRLVVDSISLAENWLSADEIEYAKRWVRYRHSRTLLRHLANPLRLREIARTLADSNLSGIDLLRAFGRPPAKPT